MAWVILSIVSVIDKISLIVLCAYGERCLIWIVKSDQKLNSLSIVNDKTLLMVDAFVEKRRVCPNYWEKFTGIVWWTVTISKAKPHSVSEILSNAIQESETVCDISTETVQLKWSGKFCCRNENKSLVFTRYVDHVFNFRVSEKVNTGEPILYVKGS